MCSTSVRYKCSVPGLGEGGTVPCESWEYDRSVFTETIITEVRMECLPMFLSLRASFVLAN